MIKQKKSKLILNKISDPTSGAVHSGGLMR